MDKRSAAFLDGQSRLVAPINGHHVVVVCFLVMVLITKKCCNFIHPTDFVKNSVGISQLFKSVFYVLIFESKWMFVPDFMKARYLTHQIPNQPLFQFSFSSDKQQVSSPDLVT